MEKLQRQNDNLNKQLEFLNSENNKLATIYKENQTMSETFSTSNRDLKQYKQQLLNKDEELIRLRSQVESKDSQIKRLSEQ